MKSGIQLHCDLFLRFLFLKSGLLVSGGRVSWLSSATRLPPLPLATSLLFFNKLY